MLKTILKISILLVTIALIMPVNLWTDDAEFRKLYGEGMEHLKKARYNEAYVSFEKALKTSPSSEIVRMMLSQTGDLILAEMITKPELKDTAIRLMELAKGARQRLVVTNEEITKWVEQLRGPFAQKWESVNMLATIGQRACPFLIEKLVDPDENIRTNAIQTLEKIKLEAVLPLIEALKSDAPMMRQNAAIILGVVRDERAVPMLKELFENKNESPEVKMYVSEALKRITGEDMIKLKSAKEYYYELAEKYYYAHPAVMGYFYGEYLLWQWDAENKKVVMKTIPDFIYNEELAEDNCHRALTLDANYDPIWPLLVCVHLSRYNEAETMLEVAQEQVKRGEVTEDDFKKLAADLVNARQGIFFASMVSKRYVYDALARSLKDNNASVSVSCIEVLKGLAEPQDLPLKSDSPEKARDKMGSPLVAALSNIDKRVRYAAAAALLEISPNIAFYDADKVIPLINETLAELVERVVLVVEPDSEIRNSLRKELTKLSCYTIEVPTAEDGISSAKRFPSKDLIIMNSRLANQVVFSVNILGKERNETVFDSLKQDVRTKAVPICLIGTAGEIESANQIFQETVQGYLAMPLNKDLLKEMTEKVFQPEKVVTDSKQRAERMVRMAVTELAELRLENCIYAFRETLDALSASLENRPDQIKIPAAEALGRFGDTKSLKPLKAAFVNRDNSKEVRVELAHAIGEVLRVNPPETISTELYETLRDGLLEDDVDVQNACAKSLANAKLTLAQQRELFILKGK